MKPSDYYVRKEDRKQDDAIELPSDNYVLVVTKHAPNDKFSSTIDMQFEVDEGFFKGTKFPVKFASIKKDGSPNPVAKRIYSDLCDELIGGMPNEFYELLGKKALLRYKSTATENGVYHNVSVPYKSKIKSKVAPIAVGDPIPTTPKQEEAIDEDIPF